MQIEGKIGDLFSQAAEDLQDYEYNLAAKKALGSGLNFLTSLLGQLGTCLLAAYLVFKGQLSPGDFITVTGITMACSVPLYWIAIHWQTLQASRPSRKAIQAYLAGQDEQSGQNTSLELKPGETPELELIDLSFAYYQPDQGQILVNQIDLFQIKNWDKHCSIMRQEMDFLPDSLRNNLLLYKQDLPDQVLINYLESIGLSQFANQESLDLNFEKAGRAISGGEARRLSFLRSLIKPSEILILDEPLANIDSESMKLICKQIFQQKNRLVILVSHQEPLLGPGDRLAGILEL